MSDVQALPPELHLRPASNDDRHAVTDLIVGILSRYGLSPDHSTTDADLENLEAFYHKAGGCFDVLIESATGRLVGTVGLRPLDQGSVELRKMYLDSGFRGRGLGRFLLDHALAEARRRKFERVLLETATVLKEALQLYRSAGFQPCEPLHAPAKRCDLTMELWLSRVAT